VEGVYVFELKATDAMGATGTDMVKVTVLANPAQTFSAKLYPNPATTNLNIEINSLKSNEKTSVQVFDMNGRIVYRKEAIRNQTQVLLTINVSGYSAGGYFVKITSDNTAQTFTFIKQ